MATFFHDPNNESNGSLPLTGWETDFDGDHWGSLTVHTADYAGENRKWVQSTRSSSGNTTFAVLLRDLDTAPSDYVQVYHEFALDSGNISTRIGVGVLGNEGANLRTVAINRQSQTIELDEHVNNSDWSVRTALAAESLPETFNLDEVWCLLVQIHTFEAYAKAWKKGSEEPDDWQITHFSFDEFTLGPIAGYYQHRSSSVGQRSVLGIGIDEDAPRTGGAPSDIEISATFTAPKPTWAASIELGRAISATFVAPVPDFDAAIASSTATALNFIAPVSTFSTDIASESSISGQFEAPISSWDLDIFVEEDTPPDDIEIVANFVAPISNFSAGITSSTAITGAFVAPVSTFSGEIASANATSLTFTAPVPTFDLEVAVTNQIDPTFTAPISIVNIEIDSSNSVAAAFTAPVAGFQAAIQQDQEVSGAFTAPISEFHSSILVGDVDPGGGAPAFDAIAYALHGIISFR